MLTPFRSLQKKEHVLLEKQMWRTGKRLDDSKLKQLKVSYEDIDPFTVCIIKVGNHRFSGAAKRMRYKKGDDPNPVRGMEIAFSKAARNLVFSKELRNIK